MKVLVGNFQLNGHALILIALYVVTKVQFGSSPLFPRSSLGFHRDLKVRATKFCITIDMLKIQIPLMTFST